MKIIQSIRDCISEDFRSGIMLDYGCNDGHVTWRLFGDKPSNQVYIADLEDQLSDVHRLRNWTFLPINEKDSSVQSSNEFFDAITCIHVLEHVPCPSNPMQEFHRILKKGGRLYVETPNPRSLLTPSFSNDRTWNFWDDATHLRPYSAVSLSNLCSEQGFRILKTGIYRDWKYALALPIAPILSLVLKDWRPFHYALINAIGWSSYCYCEKK